MPVACSRTEADSLSAISRIIYISPQNCIQFHICSVSFRRACLGTAPKHHFVLVWARIYQTWTLCRSCSFAAWYPCQAILGGGKPFIRERYKKFLRMMAVHVMQDFNCILSLPLYMLRQDDPLMVVKLGSVTILLEGNHHLNSLLILLKEVKILLVASHLAAH